jgi:hypothetical protein
VHCAVFTKERNPRVVVVVKAGASLLRLVRCSWLEGAFDVVFHEPALLEHVHDGDLVVRAWRVQEPLEVVLGRCGLGQVALGAQRLALHRRVKVVVMAALVILFLLFKARGRPLAVVYDLLPFP